MRTLKKWQFFTLRSFANMQRWPLRKSLVCIVCFFKNNVKLIVSLFIPQYAHDWILRSILLIRNSQVKTVLPEILAQSLNSKTISAWYSNHYKGHHIWFANLPNPASFCIWLCIIFDIPLTLPQRRENSGCMSPHNWTVTTQTSIHSNRLYLTLIIFTYNIHTHICLQQFLRNTAKRIIGLLCI